MGLFDVDEKSYEAWKGVPWKQPPFNFTRFRAEMLNAFGVSHLELVGKEKDKLTELAQELLGDE